MYFSKLEFHADAGSAAEAIRLCGEALALGELVDPREPEAPAALDRVIADLAAQHAADPLTADERARLGALYGSVLGEILRAGAGGEWGTGTLFAERVPGGLRLGEVGPTVWPWQEVRERILGRFASSVSERVEELRERAAEQRADEDDDGEPRLYPLQAGEGYFEAGVARDGTQVLMAAFYPVCFAITFDAGGELVGYEERPRGGGAPDERELDGWKAEIGFRPATIRVRRFTIPERGLGIEDLCGFDEELLEDPGSEPDPDERARRLAGIRAWMEEGCFVLYWGNDLWLDGTGQVTSS